MSRFVWIAHNRVQEIYLDKDTKVRFNNGEPHGNWEYTWCPTQETGTFVIWFHHKAKEDDLKEHVMVQIKDTNAFLHARKFSGLGNCASHNWGE